MLTTSDVRFAVPPEGLPVPEPTAEEVRRKASEILARPEFRHTESLYDRVVRWIGERLSDVLSLFTGGGRGALLAWVILLAALGAVAYVVVRVVINGRPGPDAAVGSGVVIDVSEARRRASAWLAEAAEHEAAGRWRDAVRCRWRALVASLAERGRLEEIPGRTAGDYRQIVTASAPEVSEAFTSATEVFEAAWYGRVEVSEADRNRVQRALVAIDQRAKS